MKKKLITIGIIGMFLLPNLASISAVKIKTGTFKKSSVTNSDITLHGNGPDLVIIDLISWYASTQNWIYFFFNVTNKGSIWRGDEAIAYYHAFYADENPDPFTVEPNLFPIKIWPCGFIHTYLYGFNLSHYLDESPKNVTVETDYTNEIHESNEHNNKCTVPVLPDVTISGTVYAIQNGEKTPLNGISLGDPRLVREFLWPWLDSLIMPLAYTNETGHYRLSVPAKKPFNETHRYTIETEDWEEKYEEQTNMTVPIKTGDNTTLDFTLNKKKAITPSVDTKPDRIISYSAIEELSTLLGVRLSHKNQRKLLDKYKSKHRQYWKSRHLVQHSLDDWIQDDPVFESEYVGESFRLMPQFF